MATMGGRGGARVERSHGGSYHVVFHFSRVHLTFVDLSVVRTSTGTWCTEKGGLSCSFFPWGADILDHIRSAPAKPVFVRDTGSPYGKIDALVGLRVVLLFCSPVLFNFEQCRYQPRLPTLTSARITGEGRVCRFFFCVLLSQMALGCSWIRLCHLLWHRDM